MASSYHGKPRSTQDIDLVIDPDPGSLDRFVDQLDDERFSVGDARAALRHRSQFNAIDSGTGWKVDLIIRKERPFSLSEAGRPKGPHPAIVLTRRPGPGPAGRGLVSD